MSDSVQGSNQDNGSHLKNSLRSVDKSKPPPKKPPPPQIPHSDSGDDIGAPRLPPKPVREQARALYDYKAQNDDELTIKKGDIIVILSKGVEDEGWWKGELNGKIGVFPDNYIEVIRTPPMDEVILPLRTKKLERPNEKPPPSGSPAGGISLTNPTGSIQSKLESVRNINNLKSTQQQQQQTPTSVTDTSATINSNLCSTPISTLNPLSSSSLVNEDDNSNNSLFAPLVPSKKPKFKATHGVALPKPPVPGFIKPSALASLKADTVSSHDTTSSPNKLDISKENKSMSESGDNKTMLSNNNESSNNSDINLGSLESSTKRLNHPTAHRVKGPTRRPPSMIVLSKDGDTEDEKENIDSESKLTLSSPSSSNITASTTPPSRQLSLTPPPSSTTSTTASTTAATSMSTSASGSSDTDKSASMPPWMKELKRNQAERRNKTDSIILGGGVASTGDENPSQGQSQVPLSPTKTNPSRSISLPHEINETGSSTSSSSSSSSTANPLFQSRKPLQSAKTITYSSSVSSNSTPVSSNTPTPPIKSSTSIGNISNNNKTEESNVSAINKNGSDFSDIQTELSNLKKSMVPRKDYEDLVKKVNELKDMVETVKESYGSVVRDLINQVAEARKNMATLEIEVDRLRKLSTTV